MTPAPRQRHQRVLSNLNDAMRATVPEDLEVLTAQTAWPFPVAVTPSSLLR